MSSFKNSLLIFLAGTTLTFGGLAWWQARELATREIPAGDALPMTAVEQRAIHAEQRVQALEAELASAQITGAAPAAATSDPAPKASRNRTTSEFRQLRDDPEVRRLTAVRQKGALDSRYARLFKSLNLSPQQLENFKRLLLEKQASAADVFAVARTEGLNARTNPDALRALVTQAQAEVDDSIQATIGSAAFAEYKQYEATLPYRGIVGQLEQRTSYGNSPLTEAQSQQMMQIFAAAGAAAAEANPNQRRFSLGGAAYGSNAITNDTLTQAQAVLNSTQLAALQQLQQEQQAQAELNRLMRSQRRATPGSAPQASGSTAR